MGGNDSSTTGPLSFAKAVRSPLGFFSVVAGIVNVLLGVVGVVTDKISLLYPLGVLVFLVVVVGAIALFKPLALYHPGDLATVTVSVRFPGGGPPPRLNRDHCRLKVYPGGTGKPRSRSAGPTNGNGGWYVRLTPGVALLNDTVSMELEDGQGSRWEVLPFDPYATTQEAHTI